MNRRTMRRSALIFNPYATPGLLFNSEGGESGGGTPPAGSETPPAGEPKGAPPAALTQADIDRIVNDRLTRERAKFADYGDLKAKATKFDEAEAAKAPELERVASKARDEGAAAARAELTRERVLDKIEVAAAGKFADVEDAQLHLGKRAEEFLSKDGAIDTAAITAAVDKLLTDKPHLAAVTKTPVPAPGRVGIGTGSTSASDQVAPGLGRLQHAYAQSPHK